jgi:phytoene synthase
MAAAVSPDPADLAAVEAIVLAAGTSFHRAMLLLPAERRRAMYAVYAFCRIVDDIADEEAPFDSRKPRLDAWRARIAAVFQGQSGDAVTRELASAVPLFALREADFVAVIDGMEMDANPIVAPDLATLDLYCDRVAAAVGRLSVRVFGDASPAADSVAYHLGRALQLTNILRDINEDAGRGRLYLPREYLDAEGVPADPAAARSHPALARVSARLAALAQGHFRDAATWMQRCNRRAMRPARLMGATYAAMLAQLERQGWAGPVKLSKPRKVGLLLRYGLW